MQKELQKALAQAEESSATKSAFLANMSHELRTPLNAIIGFSDLMLGEVKGKLEPAHYRGYLTHIRESGGYLMELIEDILKISEIEARQTKIEKEPEDILAILTFAMGRFETLTRHQNNALILDDHLSHPTVHCDAHAMKQIMINLIMNAVKFSPPNQPITIKAWQEKTRLYISITDKGRGIPQELLPIVTERFTHFDNDAYQAKNGAGLGLSIVKSLVHLHGGNMEISSRKDEGTEVRFWVPMEEAESMASSAPQDRSFG